VVALTELAMASAVILWDLLVPTLVILPLITLSLRLRRVRISTLSLKAPRDVRRIVVHRFFWSVP
jgi:hypothetical protein